MVMLVVVRAAEVSCRYRAWNAFLITLDVEPLPKALATLMSPAPVKVRSATRGRLMSLFRFSVPAAEPMEMLPVMVSGEVIVFVPLRLLMAPAPPAAGASEADGGREGDAALEAQAPPEFTVTILLEPNAPGLPLRECRH